MNIPRVAVADSKAAFEAPAGKSVGTKRTPELETVIGARLRVARIAARMSQGDLGAVIGVSYQQIQKYERGADRVAASTLQSLATALGIHPGSFFDGEMPTPTGRAPEVRGAMKVAADWQKIRNPGLQKRLAALIATMAEESQAKPESGD